MYYALILLSVVMFGFNFALNDVYRKKRGSGFAISIELSCVGAVAILAHRFYEMLTIRNFFVNKLLTNLSLFFSHNLHALKSCLQFAFDMLYF